MDLVLGGYAAGKLEYVLDKYAIEEGFNDYILIDENSPLFGGDAINREELEKVCEKKQIIIINHLHLLVRNNDLGVVNTLIDYIDRPKWEIVIICDEIGNGIIPMEKEDRDYRDRLGLILVELAKRADSVYRIICGMPLKIK